VHIFLRAEEDVAEFIDRISLLKDIYHVGFDLDDLHNETIEWLQEGYEVIFTGHSLGGGIANIFSFVTCFN